MFIIITPVFDGCCASVGLLVQDLLRQTYTDFQQILISNGSSLMIKELIDKVNDNRFKYEEYYPFEETPTAPKLIENLGKRRNYCLKKFDAERYFFFDADLKVINDEFFSKIKEVHDKADIILSKVFCHGRILPEMPIKKGNIDIANYSFSRKIAKKYDYPMEYEQKTDISFDWRFYSKIKNEGNFFSDILYAHKDGHNSYKNLSSIYLKWVNSPKDTTS